MKWFRLYSEARNDAKLRSLTDAQHRVWFNLLCYASEMEQRGCISAIDRELLAVECAGADTDLLNETIEKLTRLRIVTAEAENVCFVNFMKRQYDKPSAAPERVAERVSKHRATKPEASNAVVTPSNASVTPEKRIYSDTDLYSDSENTQKILRADKAPLPPGGGNGAKPYSAELTAFWSIYPSQGRARGSLNTTNAAWANLTPSDRDAAGRGLTAALSHSQFMAFPPAPHRWLKERRWETFLDGLPIDAPLLSPPPRPVSAVKAGAASSAEYYTARIDGILGGPRA